MTLTLPILLPLISAIFVFCLGVLVYFKNKKSQINIIFGLHALAITIWLFGTFMMFLNKDMKEVAIFWDRFIYIGVVFIPIFLYHFSIAYCGIKNQGKIVTLGYFLSFIFLILSRTDYFVSDLFRYKWGVHTKARFFHHIYLVYFCIYVLLWFYNFYRYYRKTTNLLAKQQTKYVFIAFFLLFTIGPVAFLPAYGIGIYPFAYISGVIFTVILAYAIIRYRFMDILVVIRRGAVFTGLVIAVTAAYVFFTFLMGWVFFGGAYTLKSQLITGLIVAIATAAGFIPLTNWLRESTDRFLFKGTYNPQELLADISNVLSRTLDLDKVIKILKGKMSQALRLSSMDVLVLSSKNVMSKEQKTEREKQIALSLNKIIDYFLRKQKEVLILEELKRKYADKIKFHKSFLLIKDIETIGTNVIVPLYIKRKLVGLFLIGNKKSGDMFSVEDVRTLETIASQAAIAIENARLYDEIKNFSHRLELEVARQTKNLREANEKLKELDKAKSLFISLASHQLRTPLTAIQGYVSMILEGDWGKLKPEQEEQLKKVFASAGRLIKLVEDLLALSRIESGRFEFKLKKISLEKLIRDLVQEFEKTAEKKGLYLKCEKPAAPMPMVKVDALKTRQIFQNLIDNAIHYTEKGGITISFKQVGNQVVVSVQDTGIGISEKDKTTLFEKFSRGKDANKLFTEGTGLGLYFSAKLVKAHKGDIWVESEGLGKGSTFFVSLPAVN